MLAHNLKEILTLLPEATELVKQANLEEEFPTDCKDSVAASYLRMHYLEKVASKAVDPEIRAKLEKAASLYDLKEKLDFMIPALLHLEKTAIYNQEKYGMTLKDQEALFEGDLGGFGFLNLEKAAETAKAMLSQYGDQIKSAEVKRYAGHAWLNKEAAVKTLGNRYYATKDPSFVKVAQIAAKIREDNHEDISNLCSVVTQLDKKAGLDIIGFNFYREALITKEAAFTGGLTVCLDGAQIPYEKVVGFGKDRIGSIVGKDVAAGMTGNPIDDKAMLESLPRDLQIMLKSTISHA